MSTVCNLLGRTPLVKPYGNHEFGSKKGAAHQEQSVNENVVPFVVGKGDIGMDGVPDADQ